MVREPRDEVDTRSLTDQRVRDISQFLGCEWVDSDPQAIASALTRSRKHQELWPFLICAVIVMALLELLLERAWTMQKEKGAAQ